MFSRVKDFINRHKRKFIATGVVVGGAWLLSRYAQRKIREWHEKETKELLDRTRKQQHFESLERTCNNTALQLAPNLKTSVCEIFNTENILQHLESSDQLSSKVLLWEDLKVKTFSKLATLVYANSMFIVFLRIQLNILGGYMFKQDISNDLQGHYLSRCQYLIEKGVDDLSKLIETKVKNLLADKTLKAKLTLRDVEQIFWSIQSSLTTDSRDPVKNLPLYLLPTDLDCLIPDGERNIYDMIVRDTHDLLENEETSSLVASCISSAFASIMDQLAEFYLPSKDEDDININSVTVVMVKIIPHLDNLVKVDGNLADKKRPSWIEQLLLMDGLKVFGANVYEAFSY